MSKFSRDKGKRAEKEAARLIRLHWHAPRCIRAAQANGKHSADLLHALPGAHVEVKARRNFAVMSHLRQAEADAAEGELPVVVLREDGDTEPVVMLRLPDAATFAEQLAANLGEPIHPAGDADLSR